MNPVCLKRIARVIGNFGVAFFGPLLSSNVADSLYDINIDFSQTLIIAMLSAAFQTGFVLSQEVKELGYRKT